LYADAATLCQRQKITYEGDDVDEYLVTQYVDVQFAGNVTDQFHEHVLVRHLQQLVLRLAFTRTTFTRGTARELPTSQTSKYVHTSRCIQGGPIKTAPNKLSLNLTRLFAIPIHTCNNLSQK